MFVYPNFTGNRMFRHSLWISVPVRINCLFGLVNANKGIVASRFLDSYAVSDAVTLAVGDSIYDVDMMPFVQIYKDSAISGVNVLILPPQVALDNLNEFEKYQLERLWRRVTCLLIADDFWPLVELIRESRQSYTPDGDRKKPFPTKKVQEILRG